MRTVSNAGPLIHLSWINQLDLLQRLFSTIMIPVAVQREVFEVDESTFGMANLRAAFAAGWIDVQPVASRSPLNALIAVMDAGEAEAIALALEINADQALIDDRRARIEAERRGIEITGTVGILRAARDQSMIPAAAPLLADLRRMGFWCSESLFIRIQQEEATSSME